MKFKDNLGLLLIILTALICTSTNVFCQNDTSNPYINAPESSDYPDADAVILYEKVDILLNEDGIQSKRYYQVIKLFSDLAVDELCDPKIKYDDETQNLKEEDNSSSIQE